METNLIPNLRMFIGGIMTSKAMQRVISNSYNNPTLQFKLLWFAQLYNAQNELTTKQIFEKYVDVLIEARKAGFKFDETETFEWNELIRVWDLPNTWRI